MSVDEIGHYALIGPVERKGLPPKHFLVRMTPETTEKHRAEMKSAKARCTETKTGAKFCLINYDKTQLEGMEMCNPIYEFKKIIEIKESPTVEECRKAEKNDFLIIKIEEAK